MRRTLWFALAATITALPSAGWAALVPITTPALVSQQGFVCNVTNLNSLGVSTTITLRAGTVSRATKTVSIPANGSDSISFNLGAADTEYCVVSVDSTYAANMRAALSVVSGSTSLSSVNGIQNGTSTVGNGTVTTPVLNAGTSDVYGCTVVNTDSSSHDVTIAMLAGDGSTLISTLVSLPANGEASTAAYGSSSSTAYCNVTASTNAIARLLRLGSYLFSAGNSSAAVEGS